jgi:hypothetical protein
MSHELIVVEEAVNRGYGNDDVSAIFEGALQRHVKSDKY